VEDEVSGRSTNVRTPRIVEAVVAVEKSCRSRLKGARRCVKYELCSLQFDMKCGAVLVVLVVVEEVITGNNGLDAEELTPHSSEDNVTRTRVTSWNEFTIMCMLISILKRYLNIVLDMVFTK